MKRTLSICVLAAALSGCSFFGVRSGYEQPQYDVVDRLSESIEIRVYEPRLAAEAVVASDAFKEGRSEAFRLLFRYISGNNLAGTKVDMTAPVESAKASEQIAMTTPVEAAGTRNGRVYMRFFLPRTYSKETAPKPLDTRVQIVTLSEQTVAAIRFSGISNEETLAAKTEELMSALDTSSWNPTSPPVAYFYDPPWTLPFLRRNEVVVDLSQ